MNTTNLKKLADKIQTVPQEQFDMAYYISDEDHDGYILSVNYDCNTVACAVGWSPQLVEETFKIETFSEYVERVFGFSEESLEFKWLFSSQWFLCDNTTKGVADRIKYILDFGIPTGFERHSLECINDMRYFMGLYR